MGEKDRSQAQMYGAPKMKTWEDYREGCLATFGGGYQTQDELEIFRHGMGTIFNMLDSEFPCPTEMRSLTKAQERIEELEERTEKAKGLLRSSQACSIYKVSIRFANQALSALEGKDEN